MSYIEISDSVVLFQNDWGSNAACIALDDELLFVDVGLNTSNAANFRKAMEEKYQKKTSTLILTHGHIDHFLGMAAFKDVQVVAPELSKAGIERFVGLEFTEQIINNMASVFDGFRESVGEAEPFMPHKWMKDRMTFGKNHEVVFQVVGGHTECSSSVHFMPDNIVISGDLLQVERYPYFGEPDTDIVKWITALKTWENAKVTTILPGHGRSIDLKYLSAVRTYFEDLLNILKELKKEELSPEEVVKHPKLPKGYWPDNAKKTPYFDYSIANVYKML
jgi:glyoxylase-like metal-dependent hydrolase (beta-lactamase superfamily II)